MQRCSQFHICEKVPALIAALFFSICYSNLYLLSMFMFTFTKVSPVLIYMFNFLSRVNYDQQVKPHKLKQTSDFIVKLRAACVEWVIKVTARRNHSYFVSPT